MFLRLSLYLIAGILAAFYFPAKKESILVFGIITILFFFFAYFRAKSKLFPDSLFGIASFILIFSLGYVATYFSLAENQPNHYINQDFGEVENAIILGKISEELKPSRFSQRFILETESLISDKQPREITGKLLLNIKIDSLHLSTLKPGMKVLLPWTPVEIKEPLNPFQFSYRNYVKRLKVEGQMNTEVSRIRATGLEENSLLSYAWGIREELIYNLKKHNFGKDELAVFQALILGQRRDISDNLYKNYAAAGAIHILAISGLHIGILLLILNFLLKPLQRFKFGKYIKPLLLILLLWSFALLTGFSPSVVRAVSMFSFIAIGLQLKRKTSLLNSLFLSLFVILLINPYYIFQVGFQLSYLAVFSIIMFQPLIYKLFTPSIKVIDYLWKLTSVSLAAQIGVIPLGLYYFHQFPGLFLLSNLVVLPFLGVILATGILVIILASVNLLPRFVGDFFNSILKILNVFIEWIGGIDSFVFSGIDLNLFQSLCLYMILLGIIICLRKVNFYRLCFILISILVFQVSWLYSKIIIPASELVIFHKPKESIFGIKENEKLKVYSENYSTKSFLDDYIRVRHIEKTSYDSIPEIMNLSEKLILIIDTTRNYNIDNFKPKILILKNSPKINLERLINQFSPDQIIADGSNYYSFIDRWRETAMNKKIPFHYTGEKGAYILKDKK